MKRWMQTGLMFGAFLVLAAAQLWFQSPLGVEAQPEGCSVETLSGSYIYAYDGFSVNENGQTPYAYAGQEVYNGDGSMSGTFSGSLGGEITQFGTYTGIYTLKADCTGTLITVDPEGVELSFDIYIDPNRGDFFFTAIDAGEVSQGWNRKVQ